MFDSLASSVNRSSKSSKPSGLTLTSQFVQAVVDRKLRVTYSCLAQAAKVLGENPSNQQLAQRGAGLVKQLPKALQPFVCRRNGGYATGTAEKWREASISWPEDLESRGLIKVEQAVAAVEAWRASLEG